jgi:hypothetical protein
MALPQTAKAAADTVVIPTSILAWFKAITIPEAAAVAALVYTLLRIAELLVGWFRKWRSK